MTSRILRSVVDFIVCMAILALFSGCGVRVLAPASTERVAQDIADIKAATNPNVPPTQQGNQAIAQLADDMAKTIDIDAEDLPRARVSPRQWVENPDQALQDTTENVSKPLSIGTGWMMAGGAAATLLAVMGLNIAQRTGGPIGLVAGIVKQVFTADKNPKEDKIARKIQIALENYKDKDPNWRSNPVFNEISDIMTQAEKDYLKEKLNA